MSARPIKLFITYSHEDTGYKKDLGTHLEVMRRNGEVIIWSDSELIAGDRWREKISENLADSDILLYLTSIHSLISDSCNEELTKALGNKGIGKVIPIILERCPWEKHQLSDFHAIPLENGNVKPVCNWRPPSEAWQSVTEEIHRAINKLKQEIYRAAQSRENEKIINAMRFLQAGNIATFLRQYEAAISIYGEAIKLDPKNADIYYNQGTAKNALGKFRKAIGDFNKSIKLNPRHTGAYNNRGNAKSRLGRHEEAIADYNKAIALRPRDADTYTNRGIAKDLHGEHDAAIEDFNNAIELNSQREKPYCGRGNAKLKAHRCLEAIADFNKAIELNPQYADAYYNRGLAKKGLNDPTANQDFEKALTFAEEQGLKKLVQLIRRAPDQLNKKRPLLLSLFHRLFNWFLAAIGQR